MSDLQRALEISVEAHKGQKEKDGSPYVLHPIRLMLSLESSDARIAALLHDVVEDTPVTIDELHSEGFSETVLTAVGLLTHLDHDDYDDYVDKLSRNPVARQVKLADLTDNMNIKRLPDLGEKDLQRLAKYHRVWNKLKTLEMG
jgi:(p)ppGpp synthase/HD superfamily hydrolase